MTHSLARSQLLRFTDDMGVRQRDRIALQVCGRAHAIS
jgi:hypothetical protein